MNHEDEILEKMPALRWTLEFVDDLPWKPRPDGSAYRLHLIRVAHRVLVDFAIADPDMVNASLLHDTLEDQAEALKERGYDDAQECLRNEFNDRVCDLVTALTNEGAYAEHVARTMESEAAPIKLADFLDNALRLDGLGEPRRSKLRAKYGQVAPLMVRWLASHSLAQGKDLINIISRKYSV